MFLLGTYNTILLTLVGSSFAVSTADQKDTTRPVIHGRQVSSEWFAHTKNCPELS